MKKMFAVTVSSLVLASTAMAAPGGSGGKSAPRPVESTERAVDKSGKDVSRPGVAKEVVEAVVKDLGAACEYSLTSLVDAKGQPKIVKMNYENDGGGQESRAASPLSMAQRYVDAATKGGGRFGDSAFHLSLVEQAKLNVVVARFSDKIESTPELQVLVKALHMALTGAVMKNPDGSYLYSDSLQARTVSQLRQILVDLDPSKADVKTVVGKVESIIDQDQRNEIRRCNPMRA